MRIYLLVLISFLLFVGCSNTGVLVDDGTTKNVNITNQNLSFSCKNCGSSNSSVNIPNPLNVTVKNTALKIYGNTNATILNFPTVQKVSGNMTVLNPQTNVILQNMKDSALINSTFTANGQSIVFTDTSNFTTVSFLLQPAPTYGATTIQFEVSMDNIKWASTKCSSKSAQTILTNTGSVTNVTNAYVCSIDGFNYFRLRTSAWASGTLRVYMKGSNSHIEPTPSVGTNPVTQSGTWTVGFTATQKVNLSTELQNSQSVKTIDIQHANSHAGRDWYFNEVVSLASNSNVTYRLNVTSTALRQPHFYFSMSGEQTINCTFWEAPTITNAGTTQTQFQRNRNIGTTLSPSMYVSKSPLYSAKGTLLNTYIAFASGSGQRLGSSDRDLNEWVLKTSTVYLLICKNQGSQTGLFNFAMDYYYTN